MSLRRSASPFSLQILSSPWVFLPVLALLVAGVSMGAGSWIRSLSGLSIVWPAVELAILLAAVFAAVHHAEHIAHALGEPFGTLVLTISVTVIECALILTIMLGGDGSPTLARDTTMAVVMLVLNLIIGLCIVVGGFKYGEQGFQVPSARSYLVVLIPFCVLTMVLPNYTATTVGPYFSKPQVLFISIVTLALYAIFLYVQTIRHREYFILDVDGDGVPDESSHEQGGLIANIILLVVSLLGIVLLSKGFSSTVSTVVDRFHLPKAVVGFIVALLVLLPECIAALQAAARDRMQTAINLALGSSLANIGLTIPAVGILSIILDMKLAFGLDPSHTVLLLLTLAVSMVTFGGGRTNILPGFVHLTLMAVFAFLIFEP